MDFSRILPSDWESKRVAWAEDVNGVVPDDRLYPEVYLAALRAHHSDFPLAVTELIMAWDAIKIKEDTMKMATERAKQPCQSCVSAFAIGVPCPHHKLDYRLAHLAPSGG